MLAQRVFTQIGKSLKGKKIPPEKIAEPAAVVSSQARMAREAGVERVEVVATAAIRKAENRDELAAAIAREAGLVLRILSEEDEARLSFIGATRTLNAPPS